MSPLLNNNISLFTYSNSKLCYIQNSINHFFKIHIFPILYLIMQNQATDLPLIKITFIIETIQMLSFPLHPKVNKSI